MGLRFEHYEHDYKNLLPNTANWNTSHDAFIPRLGLVLKHVMTFQSIAMLQNLLNLTLVLAVMERI